MATPTPTPTSLIPEYSVHVAGTERTDLVCTSLRRSYVEPWSCELQHAGDHEDHGVEPKDSVVVKDSAGTEVFSGTAEELRPGGVAREGATIFAYGKRHRMKNEPVRINGRAHYVWNRRGHRCSEDNAGEDSPGRDGELWTAGEIALDILEHAAGIPSGGSGISGHHSTSGCVTDTYLSSVITGWTASDWLALDTVPGEFSVSSTKLADALQILVESVGGFHGWYIDSSGQIHLNDLTSLSVRELQAGEQGHWQDEAGKDYELLGNELTWSLDGVVSEVHVQGQDQLVEVKPSNIEGCGNAALNGGGELEMVSKPWRGWDYGAWRAKDQPYRRWSSRGVGNNGSCSDTSDCECGLPEGYGGWTYTPRIYRGTDTGEKTLVMDDPDVGGSTGTWRLMHSAFTCSFIGFYWDVEADLAADEKLWGWYWARQPWSVSSGPSGNAYNCYGHQGVLQIVDASFDPDNSDDVTAAQQLADNVLAGRQDVRVQGRLETDGVNPVSHGLDEAYSVTGLEQPTPTLPAGCSEDPLCWASLDTAAVEVVYDLRRNVTELTLANSYSQLDTHSEIMRRLKNNAFRNQELNLSRNINDCQVDSTTTDPEGDKLTTPTPTPTQPTPTPTKPTPTPTQPTPTPTPSAGTPTPTPSSGPTPTSAGYTGDVQLVEDMSFDDATCTLTINYKTLHYEDGLLTGVS